MPTAATARFATTIGCLEGMPAATARNGVRVIDSKARAHQAIDVIDFAAVDVANAHLVNQHFEPLLHNDGIAILLFIEGHAILETGATAARDKDAQSQAGIVFLSKQFVYLTGCRRRHIKNACLNASLLNHVFASFKRVELSAPK